VQRRALRVSVISTHIAARHQRTLRATSQQRRCISAAALFSHRHRRGALKRLAPGIACARREPEEGGNAEENRRTATAAAAAVALATRRGFVCADRLVWAAWRHRGVLCLRIVLASNAHAELQQLGSARRISVPLTWSRVDGRAVRIQISHRHIDVYADIWAWWRLMVGASGALRRIFGRRVY